MKLFLLRLLVHQLVVCCLCFSSACLAGVRVAVIYPQVNQPYAKVFYRIIDDIKQQKDFQVEVFALRDGYDPDVVNRWIDQQNPQSVVVLGQRGVDMVERLNKDIPVIIGAVLYASTPQDHKVTGISLTPDPDLLFKHLKQLLPA
ncbi:MAG: hypothetical protein PVH98_12260, partial [Gammaproteobacteria bacterium]